MIQKNKKKKKKTRPVQKVLRWKSYLTSYTNEGNYEYDYNPPDYAEKKLRTPTLSMRYFMKVIFRRVRSLLLRQLDEKKKILHIVSKVNQLMRWTVNNIRPEREREKKRGDKGAKSGRHRREIFQDTTK